VILSKLTLHRRIPHRRIVQDIHLPARPGHTGHGVSKAFALVVHGLLDKLVPLIQLSQHHSSSWEDGYPEDICLSEGQAHKTEHEQPQVPPNLLDCTLVRADQRVKAQHDRKGRSDIRVVERREEEQRRHQGNVQRAVRSRESAIASLLSASHPVGEDLLDNPRQSDHADDIGRSDTANITTEDRLEDIGNQVQARWRGEFGIPSGEVAVAVSLSLRDVEDFVLGEVGNKRWLLPEVFSGRDIRDMAPGRFLLLNEPTRRAGCPGGCSCGRGGWP
jgi:hypothetical protein